MRPHLVAMAQRAVLPPLHPVAAAPHHTLRARVPHVDAPRDLFRATARAGATARVRVRLGGDGRRDDWLRRLGCFAYLEAGRRATTQYHVWAERADGRASPWSEAHPAPATLRADHGLQLERRERGEAPAARLAGIRR